MGPDRGDNAASSQLERMSEEERKGRVGMPWVLLSQLSTNCLSFDDCPSSLMRPDTRLFLVPGFRSRVDTRPDADAAVETLKMEKLRESIQSTCVASQGPSQYYLYAAQYNPTLSPQF